MVHIKKKIIVCKENFSFEFCFSDNINSGLNPLQNHLDTMTGLQSSRLCTPRPRVWKSLFASGAKVRWTQHCSNVPRKAAANHIDSSQSLLSALTLGLCLLTLWTVWYVFFPTGLLANPHVAQAPNSLWSALSALILLSSRSLAECPTHPHTLILETEVSPLTQEAGSPKRAAPPNLRLL